MQEDDEDDLDTPWKRYLDPKAIRVKIVVRVGIRVRIVVRVRILVRLRVGIRVRVRVKVSGFPDQDPLWT